MTNHADIDDYRAIKWQSCMSRSADHFSAILRDNSLGPSFDSDFSVRIGERGRELQRFQFRLLFLLLPLMLLLGGFHSELIQRITIFNISLSKDNATLSVLLLVSSILILISSIASISYDYYTQLLKAYINVHHDKRVADYFIHQFQWNIGSIVDGWGGDETKITRNIFAVAIVGLWILSLLCAAVLLQLLLMFVFIGATISVYNTTGVPTFVTIPIVVIAVSTMIFDITCLLLKCPLPFVDYSNVEKLKELEKTNPTLAEKIKSNIAKKGLERDRRKSLNLQVVILTFFMIFPTYIVSGKDIFLRYEIVVQVIMALIFLLVIVSPIMDRIEREILVRVFEIPNKELSFQRYVSSKKWILRIRLILAAAVGFAAFSFYQ